MDTCREADGLEVPEGTNDPPRGFHPIHIIVKNGNVRLEGVVDTSGDKTIAGMQANSTPGVFSVGRQSAAQRA